MNSMSSTPALLSALQGDYEPDGMDAAYRLAALNGPAMPALQDALRGETPELVAKFNWQVMRENIDPDMFFITTGKHRTNHTNPQHEYS